MHCSMFVNIDLFAKLLQYCSSGRSSCVALAGGVRRLRQPCRRVKVRSTSVGCRVSVGAGPVLPLQTSRRRTGTAFCRHDYFLITVVTGEVAVVTGSSVLHTVWGGMWRIRTRWRHIDAVSAYMWRHRAGVFL